jgi:FSR family fosmidomycin resistance protein-like MFS transporter
MASHPSVAVTPIPAGAQSPLRAGMLALALFSLGHFFIDLYSAALGVFQPLLIAKLHFSLADAGVLGGLLAFSSSVMQPVYGYLADRFRSRMFSVLAPAVAGVFIATMGLAPAYGVLVAMVLAGGAGIASFHPQASSLATRGMPNRTRWMAVFISSGTLGLAFGPAFFSMLFRQGGVEGGAWGALPGVLVTVLLLALLPASVVDQQPEPHPRFHLAPLRGVWKPLSILYLLVFIRSVVQISFAAFLPLYLSRERGYSITSASWALSLYLASGALGGFIGGQLADRFGGRRIIMISMIGSVPFLALFFSAGGALSLAGLAAGGLILLFTIPVNVVMAQELAPTQSGTVSALMMGFAWGMAGLIFIPLIGWAADSVTLHNALAAGLVLPLAGFGLAMKLPK